MEPRISVRTAQELAKGLGIGLNALEGNDLAQRLTDMLSFIGELDDVVARNPASMMLVSMDDWEHHPLSEAQR